MVVFHYLSYSLCFLDCAKVGVKLTHLLPKGMEWNAGLIPLPEVFQPHQGQDCGLPCTSFRNRHNHNPPNRKAANPPKLILPAVMVIGWWGGGDKYLERGDALLWNIWGHAVTVQSVCSTQLCVGEAVPGCHRRSRGSHTYWAWQSCLAKVHHTPCCPHSA